MAGAESSICDMVEDGSVFDVSDTGADNVEELEGDSWVGAVVNGVGSGMFVGGSDRDLCERTR